MLAFRAESSNSAAQESSNHETDGKSFRFWRQLFEGRLFKDPHPVRVRLVYCWLGDVDGNGADE